MKTWMVGLLCMVASSALLAAGPAAVRKRVQASMLVRGTIEIAPDGSVAKYTLDHPDQLPCQVPNYPMDAAYSRVSGVVYALLKIGRDGKVVDAAAEQVDLGIVASDSQLEAWQRILAAATLSALKQDTFNVPQSGPEANKPYWVARIPVTFQLTANAMSYGQWQAYVPGAVHLPEWAQEHRLAGSPDAVPEGGILLASQSLQLLTPLTGA